MSKKKKLSATLGQKVEQAKQDLSYDSKIDAAQEKLNRARKPKNFTIAQENVEWVERLSMELSLEKGKKISTSALVNAILDGARVKDEKGKTLEFIK
jgi:hypothetical protein